MTAGRQALRATFNSTARDYQQARPEYPAELFGDLVRLARLHPGDRLLEVGLAPAVTLISVMAGLQPGARHQGMPGPSPAAPIRHVIEIMLENHTPLRHVEPWPTLPWHPSPSTPGPSSPSSPRPAPPCPRA